MLSDGYCIFNGPPSEVKPYFTAPKVLEGLFKIVETLFEVAIRQDQAPVWHPSVSFYRIERQGQLVGQFYLDPGARQGKRGGAWMDDVRARWLRPDNGQLQTPVAHLVCNFAEGVNGGGAFRAGPWIDEASNTWDATAKVSVEGAVEWPMAKYAETVTQDVLEPDQQREPQPSGLRLLEHVRDVHGRPGIEAKLAQKRAQRREQRPEHAGEHGVVRHAGDRQNENKNAERSMRPAAYEDNRSCIRSHRSCPQKQIPPAGLDSLVPSVAGAVHSAAASTDRHRG